MKLIAIPFAFFVSFSCLSQVQRTYYHINNGWTDVNASGKIKGLWSWQVEYQHRREDMQGDYNKATTTGNPYHNLNLHIIRPYIHYQLNPNVRFSLMPLGWIGSNRFKDGLPSAFFAELRVTPQVILTQTIGRVRFDSRFRYEFRWLGQNQDSKSFLYGGDFSTTSYRERFRFHFKTTIPINHPKMDDKTWYFQAFDELFVNTGKNIPNTNLLDQNRILAGFGYKLNKFVAFEASYIQQAIFRFNNTAKDNVDLNNVLQLNFAITNVEQLFAAKKQ